MEELTENDIVKDILARVREIIGPTFTGEIAVKLENEVRNDWGGDRHYVAQGRGDINDRNLTIIEIWGGGEITVKQLSHRFQMSERQIQRIIKDHPKKPLMKHIATASDLPKYYGLVHGRFDPWCPVCKKSLNSKEKDGCACRKTFKERSLRNAKYERDRYKNDVVFKAFKKTGVI